MYIYIYMIFEDLYSQFVVHLMVFLPVQNWFNPYR